MDLLKILLHDKSNKTENEKKGGGSIKKTQRGIV